MTAVKVASVQFDLREIGDADDFWSRVRVFCAKARQAGCDFILFPEYFSLPLLIWASARETAQPQNASTEAKVFDRALLAFSLVEREFHSQFQKLCDEFKLAIVAGTVPVAAGGGHSSRRSSRNSSNRKKIVNRSFVYLPKRKVQFQDKQHMTRFESEEWRVSSGEKKIKSFQFGKIRFAVAICYDIEFPRYAEVLAKKNVDVIFAPSCTDDIHGYWRVRHCAEARAVETQSYVIVSSTVGGDPRFDAIHPNYGQAAFLSPCDLEFPDRGCLREGQPNLEEIYFADLDLAALHSVRRNGTVLNRKQLVHVREKK